MHAAALLTLLLVLAVIVLGFTIRVIKRMGRFDADLDQALFGQSASQTTSTDTTIIHLRREDGCLVRVG